MLFRSYKKFFLRRDELQAIRDGYIYIHDLNARYDCINCCLFDVGNVLKGGFEMGNVFYNEPNSLDTAFDVIGDITLSAASQQYGGFTLPQIDEVLSRYAKKSYHKFMKEYEELHRDITSNPIDTAKQERYAMKKVTREMEQGYQGLEYKFNTVASSRGDYPFITITYGLGTDTFARLATRTILRVHKEGQGKEGQKKPVLFPKLVFLYTEDLHGEGKRNADLYDMAIDTNAKTMYPDYLSLDGNTVLAKMYHTYGKVISPMGCRAFLSPWFKKGGMKPLDDTDEPVFVGRFNLGAISLNLPMIYQKAKVEKKPFHDVLDVYLEIIRTLHKRTYKFVGDMRASTNLSQRDRSTRLNSSH